jgi:hypothetical protein
MLSSPNLLCCDPFFGGWHDFHIHYTALSSIAFSKLKIIVKYYLRMEKSDKSLILVSNRLPFQLLEQDDQLTMKPLCISTKKMVWFCRLSRKKMEKIQKTI